MKVYLLRVCAYKKEFQDLCNVWNYNALLFDNLKKAVSEGKRILNKRIKVLLETDEDKPYKSLDEFIDEKVNYIFEVEETDLSKNRNYSSDTSFFRDYTSENWHEEMERAIKNPVCIIWEYNYKGKLVDRNYCTYFDEDSRHYYSYRPNDAKKGAGKKFALGDIVCRKKGWYGKKIYFIFECPQIEYRYFENTYICVYMNDGSFDGFPHYHLHEEDIELYKGEVSEGYKWIARVLKGEIKLSPEDKEKFWTGGINFSENISYKDIHTPRQQADTPLT